MLLGTGSAAIRRAADKQRLPNRLARCGLAHPPTRVVHRDAEARAIADDLGYPVIVKPARGAGCEGVRLARNGCELRAAIDAVGRRATQNLLVQRYISGVAASVSLLSDGHRAVALAANGQAISAGSALSYAGGRTPLDHPLAERAIDAAIRTCEAFPGLHGYVGVDLVLTSADAVVIEVNPRLTTAYLGVRSAINRRSGSGNIAEMAIDACAGKLPARPRIARHVRFTSAGRVVSV